ncbi:uncharacterized protein LOC135462731 isoform X2 [Liolophura sinensis]|uniref:uncharacterized protein LOC135462731 isoform X2 n=1 Tax=Liolophura sinensis TaxID=3198878 RepID=UPI003159529D
MNWSFFPELGQLQQQHNPPSSRKVSRETQNKKKKTTPEKSGSRSYTMKRGRKRRAVEGDVVTDEVENETGGQQAVQMNEIKKRLCELIKMRQSLRTSGAKSYPAAKSHSQDVNSACKAKVSSPVIHQPDEPQVPEGVMAQTQQDQPQLNSFVTNKPSQPQVWSVVNNQSGQPQVYSVVNNQSGQPQVYSVVNNQPGQPQLYSVVNNQPGQPQVYSAVNNEPGQPLVHSVVYQPGQPLMHSVVNNEPGQPQVYPIVPGEAQVCSIVDNQYPEGRVKPVIKVETIETANQPQIFPVVKGTKVVDNPGEEFHVKFDLGGIDISQVSLGEIPSKAGEGSLRSAGINTECADVLADHHLIASEAKSRQACVETLGTCSDVFKTECDDNVAPVQTDRETFSTTVVIKTEYADSQMCTGVVPVQAVRETLGPTVVIREEYADSEACPGVVPVHTEREILSTTVIIKTECADSLADNQVCTQVKMEPIDHPGQVDCSRWAEGGTHQRVTAQSQECGSDPLTQRSLHPATQEEEGPLIITELFAHPSASEVGSRGRAPGDSVTLCACTAPPGGELDSSASGLGIVRSAGGAVTVPCEEVYKSAKYQPLVKLERLPLSASDVVMLSQLPDKHVKWSYVSCQTLGGTNPSYLVSRDPKSPRSSLRLLSPKDTPQRKPVLVSCSDTVNLSQPAAKHDKLVSASGSLSSDVVQGQTLFGTGGSYVCPVIRNLASPGLASAPIWCNGLPLSKLVLVSSIADKPVSGNSTPSRELFGAKHGCQANRTPNPRDLHLLILAKIHR